MNNCKKCGNQILQNQKFCSNCGEPTNNTLVNQPINNNVNLQNNNVIQNQNSINNVQSSYENQANIMNNGQLNNVSTENNINSTMNNKKNKGDKFPYIILISLVVILIGVITVLLILNNKPNNKTSNNNNNKNEYEENTNKPDNNNTNSNSNINNTIDNTNSKDNNSINFKGFKLNKNNNYTYQATTNKLTIYNSNYYIGLLISSGNFNTIKANISSLEQSYLKSTQNTNMSITNLQLKNINNTEVITGNAIVEGQKGVWFIIKANSLYVYQGFIIDRTNTYNENNISVVLNLLKDAVYVGNYSSYTTTFDVKDITDKQGQ